MSTHTPGPYHIGYRMKSDGTKEAHSIYSDAGDAICGGLTWNGNGETDAHLLAAAPELLDALIGMMRNSGACIVDNPKSHGSPAIQAALAAIAKATGKEVL